jgi:hypothetical protein
VEATGGNSDGPSAALTRHDGGVAGERDGQARARGELVDVAGEGRDDAVVHLQELARVGLAEVHGLAGGDDEGGRGEEVLQKKMLEV